MARLIKRSEKPGSPWYADYSQILPGGKKKRVIVSTGTPDKANARQILAKLQSDAAVRQHGLIDPLAEMIAVESARSVASHLTDYRAKMEASGRTEKHINSTLGYIREYAKHSGCECAGDFTADTANRWAASVVENDGLSARAVEARLTAIKGFSKWLTRGDKLHRDPFASVVKPNSEADRRLTRRMLLPTEWTWLMQATAAGEDFRGMPADERVLVYRLAVQTGLRANEIRSLGRGHFYLDGPAPFVKVVSGDTKNRKTAHQNIDANLARDLTEHLRNKMPGASAFAMPSEWATATMLRADMESARRLWLRSTDDPEERANREETLFLMPTNEAGEELDFHAMRHTCGAWLAMRGVQPKVIQSVMRHSSITLTLDTYGHLIEGAEAAAIQANADLTAVPAILAATGTDDAMPQTDDDKRRFKCASFLDASGCVDVAGVCEQDQQNDDPTPTKIGVDSYREKTPIAAVCDTVQDDATDAPCRARSKFLGVNVEWIQHGKRVDVLQIAARAVVSTHHLHCTHRGLKWAILPSICPPIFVEFGTLLCRRKR